MNIIVGAYTGLGNFILKSPLLRAIKYLYPTSTLSVFIGDLFYLQELYENDSFIDAYIMFSENDSDDNKKSIIQNLSADILFLPFDSQEGLFVKQYKTKNFGTIYRHFHDSPSFLKHARRIYTRNTKWVKVRNGAHEIELNIDLLADLLDNVKSDLDTFIPISEDKSILDKFEINEPYLIVQCEAANGTDPTKCWNKENFIVLIKELLEKYRHDIILVGDKNDYLATIKYVEEKFFNEDRVIVTAGGTSLHELKNLLYFSSLVICHDSGIMHLAEALNKRLLAFFGPSDFARVRPRKDTSEVLFSQTEYFNIKEDFKKFTTKDLKKNQMLNYPMSGIKIKDVLVKIEALIGEE